MTESVKLIELSCPNIRELTKKERLYGLNIKSWYMCGMIPLTLQAYIGFVNHPTPKERWASCFSDR